MTFGRNTTTARRARNAANAANAAGAASNGLNSVVAAAAGDGRVDVYGWAVLDRMRGADGVCLDWCQEAMRQLNVSARSHQHTVCFPLYAPDQAGGAPGVCDNACPGGGECAASCPKEGPYAGLPGCGCGTCYWAWGGQWKCGATSQR